MTEEPKKPSLVADAKRVARWAAAVGATLAVICHSLPPAWRQPCNAIATICRGGY